MLLRFCSTSITLTTLILSLFLQLTGVHEAFALEFPAGEANVSRDSEDLLTNANSLFQNGQYEEAIRYFQIVLNSAREQQDRQLESEILYKIALAYDYLSEYDSALNFYQQALATERAIGNIAGEGSVLNSIGGIHHQQGDYFKALEIYQQVLAVRRQVEDDLGEARTLNNIALVYNQLGQYGKALQFYTPALEIFQANDYQKGTGALLNNIGLTQTELGQYEQAIQSYQQSLVIRREIEDALGEGTTLHNIGFAYNQLEDYEQAISYYQQALEIRREIGNKSGEALTLNNLGFAENERGNFTQGLAYLESALEIFEEIRDRAGIAYTLDSMGTAYAGQSQHDLALDYYARSLEIVQEIGDRPSERITLRNMGDLFTQNDSPELAIIFYKKSVNVTEAIRKDSQGLSTEQQQSYTKTISDTYRNLADLLLQQNRVTEAQQVLDLLKVQELEEYLKTVSGNEKTAQGIELLPQEEQIWQFYAALPKDHLLVNQIRNSEEVQKLLDNLRFALETENFTLPNLDRLQKQLGELEEKAVVLYPLILEDRVEIVLISANTPPIHHTIPVSKEVFYATVSQLRSAITKRAKAELLSRLPAGKQKDAQVLVPAQQLYDWLIRPLENELAAINAETILYAPDEQLRYIPLAVLHDGNQWLIEGYSINNITAVNLMDLETNPMTETRILAGAFSEGNYTFEVGRLRFNFYGLDYADVEVEAIAQTIPTTTKLYDLNFNLETILTKLSEYDVLHLATHGAFLPGQPEDSFILFGDGDRATLRDVQDWNLEGVDLVVLSACQTGVGLQLGNGEEILGLGYQMQQAGAAATIASLWIVDDQGTQLLMEQFYQALHDKSTKTEALRSAQLSLINSNKSHPFYWASFIIIGNGL